MPYFKITPHPLLVEAEDMGDAANKAHAIYRSAQVQRYQVVTPDSQVAWIEVSAHTEALDDDVAVRQADSIDAVEPASTVATASTDRDKPEPGRLGRVFRALFT